MRELSAQERAFLKASLPEGSQSGRIEDSVQTRGRRRMANPLGRISSTLGSLLSYLPLAIGIATLVVAAVATYLYIWGRDLFKVAEIERMSAEGTLGLMEKTMGQSIEDILSVFNAAPWVILGTVVLGILLMGLSMLIIGKRRNGQG